MAHFVRPTAWLVALAALASPGAAGADEAAIRIGVIAENQAVAGSSIPLAAKLAADEINAKGGVKGRKIEIVSYDDHSSSVEAVRAFQRAVSEDHVNAVVASYVSEVVLALEPWAARLKTVMITPGAASDVITANVAKDYEANKYTFHGYLTSSSLARLVCDSAKDMMVDAFKMKTAVVMSEDAAWTKPLDDRLPEECLPKAGLKVLDRRALFARTPLTSHRSSTRSSSPEARRDHYGHQHTSVCSRRCSGKPNRFQSPMLGVASQATNSAHSGKTPTARPMACCIRPSLAPDVAVTANVRYRLSENFKKAVRQLSRHTLAIPRMTRSTYLVDAIKPVRDPPMPTRW